MFDMAMKFIVLALSIEAVIFVMVFVGWLGTLTQKNMREAEAAAAQKEAWDSSRELNKTLKKSVDDSKKANEKAVADIIAGATIGGQFSGVTH